MTFMKKTLLPLFAGATSAMMFMSPAQALDIKQEMINQCVKSTVDYKVADKSTATKLCNCTVNVQSKMTQGEVWEIESYAQSGKDPSTLASAKRINSQMKQCASGLKLNKPQQPK
ncbi:hypothetical protein [Psychrobacter sp. FDAARGOS_221]|uniref:hypothetical protein n=1 Tax=Psychrobacter sp. FDAARGOS_221 TaxID=1975705 RepID=UPI000BB57174|nr:hypothetical protein [Psychrobacter sp. FDAARGOS_221]PNK61399.1 hypothetical protein A6J60_011350 [Psychrobacter sp. FDAARGOS_221]